MDKNGDGVLSYQEIIDGLQKVGQTDKDEIDCVFKGMDMDDNGQVEYTEFLAAMMDHKKFDQDDEKIKLAFKHLDFNDNGFIERNEIMKFMGCNNEEVVD